MPIARGVHTLKVNYYAGDKQGIFNSAVFKLAGYSWSLSVYLRGEAALPDKFFTVFLHARGNNAGDSTWQRKDVDISLRVLNFKAKAKIICTRFHSTFHAGKPHFGQRTVLPVQTLHDPLNGYLDSTQCLHLLIEIAAPNTQEIGEVLQVSAQTIASLATPPQQSLAGNILITLDSDETLRAHNVYLEHASEVFKDALVECSQPGPAAKKRKPAVKEDPITHELPLTGVSMHQALLLLHCVYAFDRRSWLAALSPEDLLELAAITHKFAAVSIFDLVHATLVQRCSGAAQAVPVLTVKNAPNQLQVARSLQMTGYEACIGRFLGTHAEEVDMSKLDICLADALQGALAVRAEMLNGMFGKCS